MTRRARYEAIKRLDLRDQPTMRIRVLRESPSAVVGIEVDVYGDEIPGRPADQRILRLERRWIQRWPLMFDQFDQLAPDESIPPRRT